jgi:hypothetical protein
MTNGGGKTQVKNGEPRVATAPKPQGEVPKK